jgi:hypothetical protein
MMASVLKYRVSNEHQYSRVVIIEPWAEEITLPQDKTLEIAVSCSTIGTFETVVNERYVVVWLWSGCRATLSIDGQDCTPASLNIPVPEIF